MGETKVSETKPKKLVSRNVAVALGIICIILVALIAYFTVVGISAQNSYNNLQNQNNQLQNIVNLANSTVWVNDQTVSQPAGGLGVSYTTWSESASYAGYVSIDVLSSTTSKTFANVVYSAYGVNYNDQVNIGTSGTAYFPVLPSSTLTVEVGNGNLVNGATETVTITYYY